jgi:hypothetical protein
MLVTWKEQRSHVDERVLRPAHETQRRRRDSNPW